MTTESEVHSLEKVPHFVKGYKCPVLQKRLSWAAGRADTWHFVAEVWWLLSWLCERLHPSRQILSPVTIPRFSACLGSNGGERRWIGGWDVDGSFGTRPFEDTPCHWLVLCFVIAPINYYCGFDCSLYLLLVERESIKALVLVLLWSDSRVYPTQYVSGVNVCMMLNYLSSLVVDQRVVVRHAIKLDC